MSRFFLGTILISWLLWLPLVVWSPGGALAALLQSLGSFGPSAAAAWILLRREGRSALVDRFRSLWRWRLSGRLWGFVLAGPAAVVLTAIATARSLGAPPGAWEDPTRLYLVVPVFAYVTVLGGPLGEEFGWRGFALPRLQHRLHPTVAAVILGGVWGLWHLPLFAVEGTVQQQIPAGAFLLQTTVTSVIYAWVWNRTESLPAVIALHAAANTSVGVFPVLPEVAGSTAPLWIAVGLAAVVAVAMVAVSRGRLGYDEVSSHRHRSGQSSASTSP